jgi:hypothetical protein
MFIGNPDTDPASPRQRFLKALAGWRADRTQLIAANEGPVKLSGTVMMLIHIVPISALLRDVLREPWSVQEEDKQSGFVPHTGNASHYNSDGFLRFASTGREANAYGYTQLFRSGIAEYADGHCYGPTGAGEGIYGQILEQQIVKCYEDARDRFRRQSRSEPFYIGFSLIGIANKQFHWTMTRVVWGPSPIRENLVISPVILADIEIAEERPYPATLLPLVNTMWQVAGLEQTPFRRNGVWEPFIERY